MKLLLMALILSGVARGQAICINAGGPALPPCVADSAYVNGGDQWTQADMGGASLGTLRYGPSFRFDVPLAPGNYVVSLTFVEPNQVRAGARVFTYSVNGQQSGLVDVLAMLASWPGCPLEFCTTSPGTTKRAVTMRFYTVVALSDPWIRIKFSGLVGNAIVNQITIFPVIPFTQLSFDALPFQLGAGLHFDTSTTPATLSIDSNPPDPPADAEQIGR